MPNKLTLRCLAAALLIAPCLSLISAAHAQQPPLPEFRGLDVDPGLEVPDDERDPGAGPSAESEDKANEKSGSEKSAAAGPKEPQDRDAMLAELYEHLAKAPDAESAAPIASTIEGLWLRSESVTIDLLMRRAVNAINDKNPDLALKLLNAVVQLQPDYAEGWSRRAYLYYTQNDYQHAVGDLRRVLALDPNHYRALDGLARILRETGQKKSALGVYKKLMEIYPHFPEADEAVEELSVEVEGRGI